MMELERHRSGEWSALEAIEAGDVDGASGILLALVDDGGPAEPPHLPCPECGLNCRWPGRLEQHLLIVHNVDVSEAA